MTADVAMIRDTTIPSATSEDLTEPNMPLHDDVNDEQQQQDEPNSPLVGEEEEEGMTNTNDSNATRTYNREDLEAWNLVEQPLWVFDIVRRSMWYANQAAVELWSAKSLPELLARDFQSDMSDSTKHRLDDYLLKFSSDENCVIKEQWTFYPNQQGPKTVDCRCRGIPIEEGRLALFIQGTFKETTTEAEQEALRAVEMLRHLPVAVCLTDLEGNIMEQNPEALAVFGTLDKDKQVAKEEEGLNSGDSAFVKKFVDKELGQRILKEARTGKEVHRLEALQHTVLGPRWSAIQVRQTKDPVTSKPILLYSSRDITAVVEAKRQAVAADVAKMDLLAEMAHAIRTPLQHVVGVVELMSRESKTDEQHTCQDSRYPNLLQSSAQLLMTVLHDMMASVQSVNNNTNPTLNNNKATTAKQDTIPATSSHDASQHSTTVNRGIKLEHSQIDIQQVLDSAIATITPHAQVKELSVKAQVTSHLRNVNVMGDAHRLGQVLFEILHNAVKYTSRGSIAITVRRMSKKRSRRVKLRFEIKDSGVGLNLEQQRQVLRTRSWQQQRDSSGSSTATGGVGLELCKKLVEAMGGTIGVQSKPGRGATFWFEIPFLKAAAVTTSIPTGSKHQSISLSSSSDHSADSRGSRRRMKKRQMSGSSLLEPVPDDCCTDEDGGDGGLQILLVDKNNVGRNVMTALLEQSGHTVTTAQNGEEMILAVSSSKHSFDVVLAETQLSSSSRVNTYEATREIRGMGYSPESLPILALTAAVPRADYPELGFNDWLTKPMMIKDIQKAMTNAICNVGAKSTAGPGSVFTADSDMYSMDNSCYSAAANSYGGGGGGSRAAHTNSAGPSMPGRRGSFNSIQSAFSDHLQAVLGTPDDFIVSDNKNKYPKGLRMTSSSTDASLERLEVSQERSCGGSSASASTGISKKSDKPPKMIRRSSFMKQ